ncbi:hypothetical protein L249_3516 [Ophiocordyceps polyrhachis-furcata BCC 54312]|uniref:Amino acid permease/ SLC12A domain-containing protein n=1 Tax=Ophiocordyceps polyrhachis-furcata BCC 54312 TaxID=1330021 RepID=A0A367LM99_9HYPO|nr:hypothetical protein L249_3516 [Ophiocordyceps polyrhachis-furcata BCC 54312]
MAHDVELANLEFKEDSLTHGSCHSMGEQQHRHHHHHHHHHVDGRVRRFLDGFKRDADSSFFTSDPLRQSATAAASSSFSSSAAAAGTGPGTATGTGGHHHHHHHHHHYYYDLHLAAVESANTGLARKLKGRHLQMIAIGGSVGTGLFVASGKSLSTGGPASLLIAFSVVGAMLYCTCQALGELAVIFPIAGSFSSWATRFLDPSWGFAMGWNLLGIVLNCGGTPDRGYIGGEYWHNPGAFNNGFKGLCSVFVTAAFAFTGTELVGLAAAETANPRKSLPTAIKQVFWRITLFYIVALTLVGLLVPYDNERLIVDGETTTANANASPFVIAIEAAGIQVLPSIMNSVILVAVLSVGNSAVFGSSRTLAALAKLNQAPKLLGYVDRRGRPLVAIAVAVALGLLAFLSDMQHRYPVLDWLLAISGLSTVFTWGSICLCHIRFRRAWARRCRRLDDVPFVSQVGVAGSYVGLALNLLVLVAQFWVGAFPVDWRSMPVHQLVRNFFLKYMGVPIIFLFYILHKIFYQTTYVRIQDMDVDTGRRDFNLPILLAQERAERASWPRWKRFYKFMC